MYQVYILKSTIRNYIYVGLTNNIDRRFGQHNSGRERTTRAYRPFRIIHLEQFNSRPEGRKREKYLKSGIGKEWIKNSLLGKMWKP